MIIRRSGRQQDKVAAPRLPPTSVVPALGATVDFDQRFATAVKCGAFNQE
jgi:hypothetical protein